MKYPPQLQGETAEADIEQLSPIVRVGINPDSTRSMAPHAMDRAEIGPSGEYGMGNHAIFGSTIYFVEKKCKMV